MRKPFRNKKKSGYWINLDHSRRLLYTTDSIQCVECKTGTEFKDFTKLDVDHIPTLIWAGLIWEDPELKIAEVERMIQKKIKGKTLANVPFTISMGKMVHTVLTAAKNFMEDESQEFKKSVFLKMGE